MLFRATAESWSKRRKRDLNQHRHMTNVIAWTIVVVFTAAGSSLAGSLVLCVGSDGHADLEIALGACCVDEAPGRGGSDGASFPALMDPCGGCADIELDTTPLIKQKHQLVPPLQADVAGAVEAISDISESVGAGSNEWFSPPDLQAIATVVLLT